jgi:hypothetical protein
LFLVDRGFRSGIEYRHCLFHRILSLEASVHRVKSTSSYLLLAACLFLAAAGSLRALGRISQSKPQGEGSQAVSSSASAPLDFEFFKTKVQPIFLAKRTGHARCVACHAVNNSALKLQPLASGSTAWNEEESRKNFEAVQKVAVPGNLKSPLLIHPLAEEAGGDFFHGGGKHFNSQNDPEWQTLKAWVLGATAP